MKAGCILLFFFLRIAVFGQAGWNIVYIHVNEEVPQFIDHSSPAWMKGFSRLVCNDSMSFSYSITEKTDPMKERKDYGGKVLHHSTLMDWKSQRLYGGSALSASTKKHYYFVTDCKTSPWIFEDSVKTILGYRCKKAFFVTTRWIQSDTSYIPIAEITRVWYAESIPLPFGPMQYYGLPGLVLEVYDQRYMGKHIQAISISPEVVTIGIPAEIKIQTLADLQKKKE